MSLYLGRVLLLIKQILGQNIRAATKPFTDVQARMLDLREPSLPFEVRPSTVLHAYTDDLGST